MRKTLGNIIGNILCAGGVGLSFFVCPCNSKWQVPLGCFGFLRMCLDCTWMDFWERRNTWPSLSQNILSPSILPPFFTVLHWQKSSPIAPLPNQLVPFSEQLLQVWATIPVRFTPQIYQGPLFMSTADSTAVLFYNIHIGKRSNFALSFF